MNCSTHHDHTATETLTYGSQGGQMDCAAHHNQPNKSTHRNSPHGPRASWARKGPQWCLGRRAGCPGWHGQSHAGWTGSGTSWVWAAGWAWPPCTPSVSLTPAGPRMVWTRCWSPCNHQAEVHVGHNRGIKDFFPKAPALSKEKFILVTMVTSKTRHWNHCNFTREFHISQTLTGGHTDLLLLLHSWTCPGEDLTKTNIHINVRVSLDYNIIRSKSITMDEGIHFLNLFWNAQ